MDNYEKLSKVSNKPDICMYEQLVLLYGDCIYACCKVFKIWCQVLHIFYVKMEMVILLKHSTPLLYITITLLILIRKLCEL